MTDASELEDRGRESSSEPPQPPPPDGPRDPHARGIKNRVLYLGELLSTTIDRFGQSDGSRLGAALSFYAIFSIFPLLLLAVTVIGFVVGDSDSARDKLLSTLTTPDTPVWSVLDEALTAMQRNQSARGLSTAVAVASLLFSASGVCVEFEGGLHRIWCEPPEKTKGLWATVRLFVVERATAFAIAFAISLTLVASLVSGAILTRLVEHASDRVSTPLWPALLRAADLAVGIALLSFVLVLAFHFIPRARTPMRALVGGAVLTTAFLTELKELFAFYLAHLTSYSAYGVAGGILAVASWIYLSSMITYFGAQLTRVHVEKLGLARAPASPP